MDRIEALRGLFSECYRRAIRAAAEHAIELDAREASDFRESLEALAARVQAADTSEPVLQVQDSFQMALRGYRDLTQTRIDRLRSEVAASAAAVAAFAGTIALHGDDHQVHMDAELERLRKMVAWDDLAEIRRGIQGVITGISEAVAHMQRSNQMTIAQLRDEIRILHQSMEAKRRAAATDVATGAWTRQKSGHRMRELLKEDEAFRVLLISVTNFKRVEGRFLAGAVENVLKELTSRLREIVGAEPPIGRWTENEFLVLLDLDAAGAMALSRDASLKLSADYSLPDGLGLKPVHLEVASGLVERAAGSDGEAFLKRLDQLSAALVGE
jgi:GGDEF domain-containing protein